MVQWTAINGSVFISYTCDGAGHPCIEIIPAADHEPGSFAAAAQ